MKIKITKSMLKQAIAPAVKQYMTGFDPNTSKYEELKDLINDLERNIRKPEVMKVLGSVVKGGKVRDINQAKRIIDKLFVYLDEIKGDPKKLAALQRKISRFDPARQHDLEAAQRLDAGDQGDEQGQQEQEEVPRTANECSSARDMQPGDGKKQKMRMQGKTWKDEKHKEGKQDHSRQRQRKQKAKGLRESTILTEGFVKQNALTKQMQDDSRYLFGEFEKARKAKGQPASTDLFSLMIREAIKQGGSRERQYRAFFDKLEQVVTRQYTPGEDHENNWQRRRKGITPDRKQKPKFKPVGINRKSDEQKERLRQSKRDNIEL